MDPVLMDRRECARYLGVTESWLYDSWRKEGIPAFKVGGQLRFKKVDVDRWLELQRVGVREDTLSPVGVRRQVPA